MTATRERIVDAADRLFYEQGFENTSFADIAEAVQISRGNFYYHFKTKDEILDAVISARLAERQVMLARWEDDDADPAERIRRFIDILVVNGADIRSHGCPIGTLSTELAKLGHASTDDANGLFTLFRTWLRRQFALAGHEVDADALAMHLLARSQGVATLMHAYDDEAFARREVEQLHGWLAALPSGAARLTDPADQGE